MTAMKDYGHPTGIFMNCPVAGLTFQTTFQKQAMSLQTTVDGGFYCDPDEKITFSIGSLILGSAVGKSVITPLDLVPGASTARDRRVANMLALLHTLDEDGNLNNGIQISSAICDIVSTHADSIHFDQETKAFTSDKNVKALLDALNAARVFKDTDPRPRKLSGPKSAVEHFTRSVSERKIATTQAGDVKGYAANETTWQWLGIPYAKAAGR